MKRFTKILRNTALVLAAVLALYALNAMVIEQRSIQSRAFRDLLAIQRMVSPTTLDEVQEMSNDQLNNGREKFQWYDDVEMVSSVNQYTISDMDYYVINEETDSDKVVFYIHGGAYAFELLNLHVPMLDKIAVDSQASVVVPVYPLVPEYTYEDSYPKVLALYEEVLATTAPENITIMGDSAGGGHSLGLALLLKEKNLPQPGNIILLSPWLDVTMTNPGITEELMRKDVLLSKENLIYWGELWAGSHDPTTPLVSPIYGDLTGLAPITLYAGTNEIFLPDVELLHEKIQAAGGESDLRVYDRMLHVFQVMPGPEAAQSIEEIAEIVKHQ